MLAKDLVSIDYYATWDSMSPKSACALDATTGRGILERQGLSKVRHIDADVLWIQRQAARRLLPLYKVLGTENISDLMTNT